MAAEAPPYADEAFAMDGMFQMEDDYGFYEALDSDDERGGAAPASPTLEDDHSVMSIPVGASRIEDGDPDSLLTSPPILTPQMVDSIAENLTWSLQDAAWDRLFASSRDGASFGTFMRRVRGHGQTIVVAKTAGGKIVGGYATDAWTGRKAECPDKASHAFLFTVDHHRPASSKRPASPPTFIPGLEELGTSPASAFDFDFHRIPASPSKSAQEKPRVQILKPEQGLKQACRLGTKLLSLTDEAAGLSLVIDHSFSHGRVVCAPEDEEDFAVVEFEVYGFSED